MSPNNKKHNGLIPFLAASTVLAGAIITIAMIQSGYAQNFGAMSTLTQPDNFIGKISTFIGKNILVIVATPNNQDKNITEDNQSAVVFPVQPNGTADNSTGIVITPVQKNTTTVISTDKNGTQAQNFPTTNVTETHNGNILITTTNKTSCNAIECNPVVQPTHIISACVPLGDGNSVNNSTGALCKCNISSGNGNNNTTAITPNPWPAIIGKAWFGENSNHDHQHHSHHNHSHHNHHHN